MLYRKSIKPIDLWWVIYIRIFRDPIPPYNDYHMVNHMLLVLDSSKSYARKVENSTITHSSRYMVHFRELFYLNVRGVSVTKTWLSHTIVQLTLPKFCLSHFEDIGQIQHAKQRTNGCLYTLTHLGRVTHVCVSTLTIIGSYNGLSPGRRQAII